MGAARVGAQWGCGAGEWGGAWGRGVGVLGWGVGLWEGCRCGRTVVGVGMVGMVDGTGAQVPHGSQWGLPRAHGLKRGPVVAMVAPLPSGSPLRPLALPSAQPDTGSVGRRSSVRSPPERCRPRGADVCLLCCWHGVFSVKSSGFGWRTPGLFVGDRVHPREGAIRRD